MNLQYTVNTAQCTEVQLFWDLPAVDERNGMKELAMSLALGWLSLQLVTARVKR